MNGATIIGIDLTASLTLGDGLGFCPRAMAELLPHAEAGMVEGLASLHQGEADHGDP